MTDAHPITQALLAAIAHSSAPIVLSDPRLPDNPIIAANQAFEVLSGYPLSEIIGRNCRFLQGPGTDPGVHVRISRCIKAGHGCVEWIVNHRRDGRAFWNLLFISPVFDRDGNLLHFLGNQQDITRGMPDWLDGFSLGQAHMTAEVEAEFHDLLLDILEHTKGEGTESDAVAQSRALEQILLAVRRLAEVTTRLQPGAPGPT